MVIKEAPSIVCVCVWEYPLTWAGMRVEGEAGAEQHQRRHRQQQLQQREHRRDPVRHSSQIRFTAAPSGASARAHGDPSARPPPPSLREPAVVRGNAAHRLPAHPARLWLWPGGVGTDRAPPRLLGSWRRRGAAEDKLSRCSVTPPRAAQLHATSAREGGGGEEGWRRKKKKNQ